MRTLSLSEVKAKLSELVDDVESRDVRPLRAQHGRSEHDECHPIEHSAELLGERGARVVLTFESAENDARDKCRDEVAVAVRIGQAVGLHCGDHRNDLYPM